MIPVPPKLVRRVVLAPLVVAAEVTLLVASPALILVATLLSPVFGGLRPVRFGLILLVFVAHHLAATLACLLLWIASGFGRTAASERMKRGHYAVMRWFVAGVHDAAVRLARVAIVRTATPEAEAALAATGRPVVVLSRHAGEGDTLLVINELLSRHGRGPRVVLHEVLRLDPLIDVLGSRLPNRFVDPRGGDTEVEIAALAAELEPSAALVIFPEGKNFSEDARRRAIERLERGGHERQAAAARDMVHVSAPRPGGTLAAIEAGSHADVVVMGHVGFPIGFAELWRLLPEPQTIEVHLWRAAAPAAPGGGDRGEQIDWLFGCWRTLDDWVQERERLRSGAPGA